MVSILVVVMTLCNALSTWKVSAQEKTDHIKHFADLFSTYL